MPKSSQRNKRPLDKLAAVLMVGLTVTTVVLVALGDHATARVQAFSWQDRTVGAENAAFVMTFNRPVDLQSVEKNLQVTPDLPGRISWAGRRMAYTLNVPVPYGETYEVGLANVRDRFVNPNEAAQFEGFTGTFRSRDRAMAYIGTQGEEKGRLVLVNFSQGGEPMILTSSNLTVLDFEPYPLGDRLLFSAMPTSESQTGTLTPALYTVTTGLQPNPPDDWPTTSQSISVAPDEVGTVSPLLDGEIYQNLNFDLSPDGRIVIVQRVNQSDPNDFGPWILREGEEPHILETEPGGEFLIGPDNQTLLMLQGQGTAVIPLDMAKNTEPADIEPIDFLPEFGRVFDISRDGRAAALVNFNQNDPKRRFMETLVVVTNQREEIELLDVTGAILDAQFDPTHRILYVLASKLLPDETYQELPFLVAIKIENQETINLIDDLPSQSHVSMSLSPDGLAVLIGVTEQDRLSPDPFLAKTLLLPLFDTEAARLSGTPTQSAPKVLPYAGLKPTWLP